MKSNLNGSYLDLVYGITVIFDKILYRVDLLIVVLVFKTWHFIYSHLHWFSLSEINLGGHLNNFWQLVDTIIFKAY